MTRAHKKKNLTKKYIKTNSKYLQNYNNTEANNSSVSSAFTYSLDISQQNWIFILLCFSMFILDLF